MLLSMYTINLLSYLFLDVNQIINMRNIITKTDNINNLKNVIAVFGTTKDHAIGYIICNNEQLHFNNNSENQT